MASRNRLWGSPILVGAIFLLCACAHVEETTPQAALAPDLPQDRLGGKTYGWSLAGRAAQAGECKETWRFGEDGVLTVLSGAEIVAKSYRLSAIPDDSMMLLATTRLTTNGKPDCMGGVSTAVGQADGTYLQFLNDGSFFTCSSTDGLSCYGVAVARQDQTP